jgi:hypothetical protein
MPALHSRARILIVCGALSLAASCAGGTLGRIGGDSTELPKELSSDLKQRFEVKDPTTPEAAPSVLPVSAPSTAPSVVPKTKKGKKKPAPQASPSPEPIVYPSRRNPKNPIWLAEKATYGITYFGMEAGIFTLETLPLKSIDNRKVYHVRGTAESSKVFNLFYRINDVVETFIDYEGMFSHRFHLLLDETKQSRDSLELFDSVKAQTFYWNRWNHKEKGYTETKEFQPITRFPQDSLSALFYMRTVPLPTGATISFPVVSEGKTWEAVVTVVRREMMQTPLGRIQTVVVKPETKYQGVLQKRGDSFIWLTDDDRRHLIRLEAKVKIGTVAAELKRLEPGTPP